MPTIDEVWLFVAEQSGPEDEGVVAMLDPILKVWVPMVAADKARLDSLRPVAADIARKSGAKIKILKFTKREEIE